MERVCRHTQDRIWNNYYDIFKLMFIEETCCVKPLTKLWNYRLTIRPIGKIIKKIITKLLRNQSITVTHLKIKIVKKKFIWTENTSKWNRRRKINLILRRKRQSFAYTKHWQSSFLSNKANKPIVGFISTFPFYEKYC